MSENRKKIFREEMPDGSTKEYEVEKFSDDGQRAFYLLGKVQEEIQKKSKTTKSFSLSTAKPKGPEKSHADQIGLQIGDDVNHDMFGDGVIVKLEVTEYEAVATINFVDEGQKTLDLSWAPVRKI